MDELLQPQPRERGIRLFQNPEAFNIIEKNTNDYERMEVKDVPFGHVGKFGATLERSIELSSHPTKLDMPIYVLAGKNLQRVEVGADNSLPQEADEMAELHITFSNETLPNRHLVRCELFIDGADTPLSSEAEIINDAREEGLHKNIIFFDWSNADNMEPGMLRVPFTRDFFKKISVSFSTIEPEGGASN